MKIEFLLQYIECRERFVMDKSIST